MRTTFLISFKQGKHRLKVFFFQPFLSLANLWANFCLFYECVRQGWCSDILAHSDISRTFSENRRLHNYQLREGRRIIRTSESSDPQDPKSYSFAHSLNPTLFQSVLVQHANFPSKCITFFSIYKEILQIKHENACQSKCQSLKCHRASKT